MRKGRYLKAAVIGCGYMGASVNQFSAAVQPATHAGAYRDNPHIKLVGLVDTNEEKRMIAARHFPNIPLYKDSDALYAVSVPDIVSVATPSAYHEREVGNAARHRVKAVICEKPIAESSDAGRRMVAICRENGTLLFINHQRRFDPLLRSWAQKVSEGMLGEMYQADAYYYNGLFNNGPHLIDLIRLFCGDVAAVQGFRNDDTAKQCADMNIDGWLFMKNKMRIALHTLSKNYGFFELRVFGDWGMLNVSHLCFTVEYRKKIASRDIKGYFTLSEPIIAGTPRSMLKATVAHVVDCLGGAAQPHGTGEDGVAAVAVLEALRKSAEQGEKRIELS